MFVVYKNDTKKEVNIQGLKIAPGQSRRSNVLIKQFDKAVEDGELALYINDGYRAVCVKLAETVKEEAAEITPPADDKPPVTDGVSDSGKTDSEHDTVAPANENQESSGEGDTEVETENEENKPEPPADEQADDEAEAKGDDSEAQTDIDEDEAKDDEAEAEKSDNE